MADSTINNSIEPLLESSAGLTPDRVAVGLRRTGWVLAAGVGLGIFAAIMQLYYVCALIGAMLLAGLIAWQFESTLMLYALIAFVPFGRTPDMAVGGSGIGKGLYVSELMLGFLLVVWFLKYIWGNLPKNRITSAFYLPSGFYIIYCLINVWNSYLFWDIHVDTSYQYPVVNFIEIMLRVLSIGALIMMATSIQDRRWLGRITLALIFSGIYNLVNSLLGNKIPISASWWSLLSFLPAGYLTAILLDSGRTVLVRMASSAVLALFIYVVLVRSISWVSGWMGLIVVILVTAYIANKRAFLVLLVLGGFGFAASWPFMHANVIAASEEEGDFDRFDLLKGGLKYASAFPLGVGLGNYRTYNSFHYGEKWGTTSYTSAHGTYSQHLSEMGFPGTILFLSILFFGFRWLLANYRKLPRGPSKTYILAVIGQMAGISAATFIGDYIVPTYHNGGIFTFSTTIYSWLIWGLAIAHVRISRQEADGSLDSHS